MVHERQGNSASQEKSVYFALVEFLYDSASHITSEFLKSNCQVVLMPVSDGKQEVLWYGRADGTTTNVAFARFFLSLDVDEVP